MTTELNGDSRNELVANFREYQQQLRNISSGPVHLWKDRIEELKNAREELRTQYYAGLPKVVFSVCPFCGEASKTKLDLWCTDGMWWQEDELVGSIDEFESCDHFYLLRGSIDLNDMEVKGGLYKSYIGPAVPYVVPKIMELHGFKAVISRINMGCGYTAYPIAYFSNVDPGHGRLMQTWRRRTYGFKMSDGQTAFSIPEHVWDFDLEKWIDEERVGWIEGSSMDKVKFGKATECPYVNLDGAQKRQVINENGEIDLVRTPQGQEHSPFE